MKRTLSMMLALSLLWLITISGAAAEDTVPTAAELYSADPQPDVPLSCDPYIDPTILLVNKEYGIPWDYVPELTDLDLPHKPGVATQKLRPDAAEALVRLFAAAEADGIELGIVSGYRSYVTQKAIHARKVAQKGRAAAELSSAPPGKSEHQLGLAVDVSCAEINYRLNAIFGDTKEGQWLEAHCAEFGFIIRYRSEWIKYTSYKAEPWHIRYIGEAHARLVMKLHVPYEIYIEYLKMCWDAQDHLPQASL